MGSSSADGKTEVDYQLKVTRLTWAFQDLCPTLDIRPLENVPVVGVLSKHHYSKGGLVDQCLLPEFDPLTTEQPPVASFRRICTDSIDYTVLKSWLVYCQTHHSGSCGQSFDERSEISGLQLIDCQTRSVVRAPEHCAFAALSYVCGTPSKPEDAKEALKRGLLPDDIPQTIRDAIEVVLQLGLTYLWVDQCCIDQHDAAILRQQMSIMNLIYDRAIITIVAACGEDASFGLPGVGPTPRLDQPCFTLNGHTWISALLDPKEVVRSSKWITRCWTYQEGLFSRRRLIFTEEQVSFECNNMCCQETVAYDLHYLPDYVEDRVPGLWEGGFSRDYRGLDEHIEQYSRRSLSFQGDIINALSGVLRAFSSMPTPTRHYWGIPMDHNYHADSSSSWPTNKGDLKGHVYAARFPGYIDAAFAQGLCWELDVPSARREGFPSWSWAGWMGPLPLEDAWGVLGQFGDPEVKIWVKRTDGNYARLGESVITKLNQPGHNYEDYTPILRIEAWAVEVRFTFVDGGLPGLKKLVSNADEVNPRYFVALQTPQEDTSSNWRKTQYWALIPSIPVQEGDSMHSMLCKERFLCLQLGESANFSLVVRKVGDVYERLGHMCLASYYTDPETPRKGGSIDPDWGMALFDFFPPARRTVLLG